MNLRCLYCQTPFTLSRAEMLSALVLMDEKKHSHYDAHCPRCRRANSISLDRLQLFYGPNWRQDGVKMKEAAAAAPVAPVVVQKPAAPIVAEKPAAAIASLKTEPLPKATKPAAAKKTSTTAAKPAAKKPAAAKTSTAAAKKPAAKKTPATAAKPAAKKPAAKKTSTTAAKKK